MDTLPVEMGRTRPLKIKVRPEDFIVREEAHLPLEGGKYAVYTLTKRGFNTVDLILRLSKRFKIPVRDISYGGKKDRYGLTTQYIAIKGRRIADIEEKSFSLRFVGEMARPMGPDLIKGNHFQVVVRDLEGEEAEQMMDEVPLVREYGFVNYFDDQRFGSYDPKHGFIAEKLVKRHYKGALKIYLTSIHPGDRKEEKERKRFFLENWGRWEECLERSRTRFERMAFKRLLNDGPSAYIGCLRRIPREEFSLFLSAFQSYLWNLMAEEVVKRVASGVLIGYRGNYWYYYFYRTLGDERGYLLSLEIPTPSKKARMPDELTDGIYRKILLERGIRPAWFDMKKIRTAYFRSFPRRLVAMPEGLEGEIGDDEIYRGKKRLSLRFFLPRGSYGTMLLKRLRAC